MRRIGVVTVGRSDFGLYRPLLERIRASKSAKLLLFVAGAHLDRKHGYTVSEIQAAGFRDYIRVPMSGRLDSPVAIAGSMAKGVAGFAAAFATNRPDVVVVLGDRFEMHAAALAALPLNLPVAHIHGGELTEGAIDDALRHSMTKLSHLHFPSTDVYARRIMQLGEDPRRILTVGALGLDNLARLRIPSRAQLARTFGDAILGDYLLVTFHPVTLEFASAERQTRNLLRGIASSGFPGVFTAPNADTNSHIVSKLIRAFVAATPGCLFVENFGISNYYAAMASARAMVGNSSSGIIEAASFQLPVVNVGSRQRGRFRPPNVVDCGYSIREIRAAISRAVSVRFRPRVRGCNPYYSGEAAPRILRRLLSARLDPALLQKRFFDWKCPS